MVALLRPYPATMMAHSPATALHCTAVRLLRRGAAAKGVGMARRGSATGRSSPQATTCCLIAPCAIVVFGGVWVVALA